MVIIIYDIGNVEASAQRTTPGIPRPRTANPLVQRIQPSDASMGCDLQGSARIGTTPRNIAAVEDEASVGIALSLQGCCLLKSLTTNRAHNACESGCTFNPLEVQGTHSIQRSVDGIQKISAGYTLWILRSTVESHLGLLVTVGVVHGRLDIVDKVTGIAIGTVNISASTSWRRVQIHTDDRC